MVIRDGARPRRGRAVAILAAMIVACLGAQPFASALWQDSAEVPAPAVSAGVMATPTTLTCDTQYLVPIVGPTYARVSWSDVGAHRYLVEVRDAPGAAEPIAATEVYGTSVDLTAGILTSLLSGIIDLFTGRLLYVTVRAEHEHGWFSEPTSSVIVRFRPLAIGPQCA